MNRNSFVQEILSAIAALSLCMAFASSYTHDWVVMVMVIMVMLLTITVKLSLYGISLSQRIPEPDGTPPPRPKGSAEQVKERLLKDLGQPLTLAEVAAAKETVDQARLCYHTALGVGDTVSAEKAKVVYLVARMRVERIAA